MIGTASPANHGYLRLLGAEPVAYGPGMTERVRALAPDGADLALAEVGPLIGTGRSWLPVEQTFPPAEVGKAHRASRRVTFAGW